MSKPNTNKRTLRFSVTDWDGDNKAQVQLINKGNHIASKVLTKGIRRINSGAFMDAISGDIAQGYEVRIGSNELGDAIRLFACFDPKTKRVKVVAQTMGDFREMLSDKTVKLTRYGEEIDERKYNSFKRACMEKDLEYRSRQLDRECVVPSTVVECPKCGYEFRVGRALAQKEGK